MSTMTLLPCPWCGCELSSVSVSEGSTFRWRKVDGCCTDGPEVRHDTMANDQAAAEADSEERAIEAWNNRAHRAHLAHPAQAVDEPIVWWNPDADFGDPFSCTKTRRHTVPLFTRAISGEKSGPVDGFVQVGQVEFKRTRQHVRLDVPICHNARLYAHRDSVSSASPAPEKEGL